MARTWNWPLAVSDDGNITVADELEGLRQKIVSRLNLFAGTWFLDVREGVPYFESILVKGARTGTVASILNAEIMKEPEVTRLGSVNVTYDEDTRVMNYTAQIETVFGQTTVEASQNGSN